ncbi:MAG: hypothetical protein AB7U98_00330 [Candidatus Nitrosocosmicus sp.]
MTSTIDHKVMIMGIISIFGLTIIITYVLISFSQSEEVKASITNLNLDNEISTSSTSSGTAAQSDDKNVSTKTFTLVLDEFGFNGSASGPPIEVNKGDSVKINLINAGAMSHTFGMGKPSNFTMSLMKNISGLEQDEKIRHISYDVLEKMPCPDCQPKFEKGHVKHFIKPGEMVVTSFNASEAGSFKYFCMVRGHLWMGMNGPLVVNEIPHSLQDGGKAVK